MTTMPLFLESEQDDARPEDTQPPRNGLALSLDHRAWLSFLADEWCMPANEPGLYLGVNKPLERKFLEDRIAVTTWFDPTLLPRIKVLRYRTKSWDNGLIDLTKDKKTLLAQCITFVCREPLLREVRIRQRTLDCNGSGLLESCVARTADYRC